MLGRAAFLAQLLEPFLTILYGLPKAALAPLFILWFGIGLTSKVVLVVLTVFFLIFYNAFTGARETDEDVVQTTRIMGASPRLDRAARVWQVGGR